MFTIFDLRYDIGSTDSCSNETLVQPVNDFAQKFLIQQTPHAIYSKRHMQYTHVKDKLFNDFKIWLELNTLRLKLWIYNCFFFWWNSSLTVWADIYKYGHFIGLLVAVVCRSCRAPFNDFVGSVFIKSTLYSCLV